MKLKSLQRMPQEYHSAGLPLARLLPDSTDRTNEITALIQVPPSPFQTSQSTTPVLAQRQSHTGNSGAKKIERKEEGKKKKQLRGLLWSSCEANTDFHPLPVKPVSLDRTRSSTSTGRVSKRKLFRGCSESNLSLFSVSTFTSIEFPALLFAPLITWKKVNPRVIFILIFALIVVFTLVVPDGFAQ